MQNETTDTIAALCTPLGTSARAIIRLSGDQAFTVVNRIFTPDVNTTKTGARGVSAGTLQIELAGESLPCPAVVYYMPGPASYTRQDVAEIQLPGSPPLLSALLAQLSRGGVRQAQPGEFTLRAFLSGRIGLAQAQAVEDIIRAQNESERRTALARLNNGLSARLTRWRQTLLEVAGILEATLDFEDEELEAGLESALFDRLTKLATECHTLANKAQTHAAEEDGMRVLLAGLTNAGKSSLLNRLLQRDAALVSSERSTTRDRTTHRLRLGRYLLQIEDCPGIDHTPAATTDTAPTLATIASNHARSHYATCPVLLLVVDAQSRLPANPDATTELREFFEALPPCRVLLLYNKCDLSEKTEQEITTLPATLRENTVAIRKIAHRTAQIDLFEECYCSARTGYGVERIRSALLRLAQDDPAPGSGLTRREAAELVTAAEHCTAAAKALADAPELAAVELRASFEAVNRASGDHYSEDILSSIFARFCIGK